MILQLLLSGLEPDWEQRLAAALAGGVNQVQLRAKERPARELLAVAERVLPLCRKHQALFLVNDRVDVALLAGATGAHLGERSLPVERVRPWVGPDFYLGVASHDASGVGRPGANHLVFGAVFPTESHPGEPGQGLAALAAVVRLSSVPVLGIGGMTPDRVEAVRAVGAAGVAVRGALLTARDPYETAGAFRRRWDDAFDGKR